MSAGEVCSIDIAKNYGFYNNDRYYTDDYKEVKTYNKEFDRKGKLDSNAVLCTETANGNTAYPLCSLVYGMPYEQDPRDRSRCIVNLQKTGLCPAGMRVGDRCKRRNFVSPAPVPMKTRCDEKPTDWYMIPNYHLGNKFNFVQKEGTTSCMKPCPGSRMPGYVNDPAANGESAGIMANTTIDNCYTKDEYMSGKYSGTNDFCPLAWVYRLGQRQEDIVKDLVEEINKKSDESSAYYKMAVSKANEESYYVFTGGKALLENVGYTNDVTTAACSKLNKPERLQKAYKICEDIKNDPNALNDVLSNGAQKTVLKQACNSLFCDKSQDLAGTINKGPICMDVGGAVSGDDMLQNDKSIAALQDKGAVLGSPQETNNVGALRSGLKKTKIMLIIATVIIVVGFIALLIMLAWKYVGPVIKRLWLYAKLVWCYILYALRSVMPNTIYSREEANSYLDKCTTYMRGNAA